MKLSSTLAIANMFLAYLSACGPITGNPSRLQADGGYSLDRFKQQTIDAIDQACGDSKGAGETRVTFDECRLIVAGSAVRESSWDVDKSCEAWGNQNDPACGLTQSRWTDARAVDLSCNPSEHTIAGYRCNALTGLRNLRCKADAGAGCDQWGQGRSLYVGIKKHLGGNQGVFESYKYDMETVYNREDVRKKLNISAPVRSWQEILSVPES